LFVAVVFLFLKDTKESSIILIFLAQLQNIKNYLFYFYFHF